MKQVIFAFSFISLFALAGCAAAITGSGDEPMRAPEAITLTDAARNRPVPVLLYGRDPNSQPRPLAVLSHGYGGHDSDYSFIAAALVARGYLVASIEHLERPGDPPMTNAGDWPKRGDLYGRWELKASAL